MWRFTLAKAARVKPTRGITEVVKVSGNNSSSFFLCMHDCISLWRKTILNFVHWFCVH